jgi:AcrR family transcriptional regulator
MARISQQERAKVRERLLESAARHFAERGLGGANINRISVDAGYAKGTVYNYFESKEQLFGAVLAVGSEETVTRYRARAVQGPVAAHLTALLEEDVALVREHEDFMKAFLRELISPQPATQALVLAAVAPLIIETTAVLHHAQQAGEVRADVAADKLATVFLGMLTMAYVQHWASGGTWPSWDALPATTVSLFLDGARPPTS